MGLCSISVAQKTASCCPHCHGGPVGEEKEVVTYGNLLGCHRPHPAS